MLNYPFELLQRPHARSANAYVSSMRLAWVPRRDGARADAGATARASNCAAVFKVHGHAGTEPAVTYGI